jgi:hypothetical protein
MWVTPICDYLPREPRTLTSPVQEKDKSFEFKFDIALLMRTFIYSQVISGLVKGKEPTRCDKACSFIASTCFGHQYAHYQE